MANDISGGKLIERIILDAEAEAEKTLLDAKKHADEVCIAAERECSRILAEGEISGKEAAAAVFDRVRTNAELDSRKYLLQKKRELLDKAFDMAEKRFMELDDNKRTEFFSALMRRECIGGETIEPAENDMDLIETSIKNLKAEGINLKLGGCSGANSGFMVRAGSYEKDCSVGSVFTVLKDEEQTRVASILFG